MAHSRKKLGTWGENLIAKHLKSNGYTVVEKNYSCRFGEIDLIARKDGQYAFIEVKTRRSFMFGEPQEAVDPRKQKRLIRTAHYFLRSVGEEDASFRIDIAALAIDPKGKAHLNYLENALEEM